MIKKEKKILKKARKELTQGNYENAKLAYSNLIKLDSKNSLYYFESGLAHYNSYYQRENALELFDNALAYSKKDTIDGESAENRRITNIAMIMNSSLILNKRAIATPDKKLTITAVAHNQSGEELRQLKIAIT